MSKLHIYIDGTWLFKVFNGHVFDRFISDTRFFSIDFERFNSLLLNHVAKQRPECTEIGNCYFVTSLFDLPADFDTWTGRRLSNPYGGQSVTISQSNIEITKQNIAKRTEFAEAATNAGYDPSCIFHVPLKEWMLLSLLHPELKYQEKTSGHNGRCVISS